ncbi:MAG: hypothetical protein WC477_07090 [Patescibacteria group bacterium]
MLQHEQYYAKKGPDSGIHEIPETDERKYERKVNELARLCIYNEQGLNEKAVEQAIEAAQNDENLLAFEQKRHEIESLAHLLKGIEAHEHANIYHGGAWQAELIRQTGLEHKTPKPPETLTRNEVVRQFEAFKFKQQLLEAESEAVANYESLLRLNPNAEIKLSDTISVEGTDIAVLINDIKTRMTERIPNDEERKMALQELDQQLKKVADSIPDDQWGKRFEMEEIYLLRRLIHAADTGHLASVSHGTPREDLRRDRGSVDIEVTAAGDRFKFQLKTFKRGVSKEKREEQKKIIAEARRKLQGTSTRLAVLVTEDVKMTYEASLRQSLHVQTKRADKYAALQPLVDLIPGNKHHRLITVLGLTEKDLEEEQAMFEEKVEERQKIEEQLRLKREQEAEQEARLEQAREEERVRLENEEREKREAILRSQEESRSMSQQEREALTAAKQETQAQREARRQKDRAFLEKIADQRQKELDEIEAKRLKKEQQKLKAQEAPSWPPKTLANLSSVPKLKNLGLLPPDWNNDLSALATAKKRFITLFATPKKKNAAPTEADKPNDLFRQVFPTQESLESPTSQDLNRLRTIL